MSSPPTLDIEALLIPIPGENPAGASLRYDGTYDAIQEQSREEDALEQGEWKRDTKTADWPGVITAATEALATRSKDLQIAVWLTKALIKQHGFPGLRDGLLLLRELQERFWDSVYPELEDGDAEFRAGPLEWLNLKLPLSIKEVAVTQSMNGERYTWLHWDESRMVDNLGRQNQQEALEAALADGKISGEQFDKAVSATPRAYYETLFGDLQQSWEECEQLDRIVDERFGRGAPSLLDIKKALEDCRELVERIVKKKRELEPDPALDEVRRAEGPPPSVPQERPVSSGFQVHTPASSPMSFSGSVPIDPQDRADALRRLSAVAAFFRRTEPHSPVAYLVQRAVRWGEMPLEAWLQEVIKSEDVLSSVRETLGLRDTSSSDESSSSDE